MKVQNRARRMQHLEKPGSGRVYQVGSGKFGRRLARFFKRAGRKLLPIATKVASELAPVAITAASSKLGETAARKGVPDSVVNLGAKLSQNVANDVQTKLAKSSGQLNPNQKLVADFIGNNSQALLADLISRRGNGVRGLGVRGLGVRGLGPGKPLTSTEAPKIGDQ